MLISTIFQCTCGMLVQCFLIRMGNRREGEREGEVLHITGILASHF